VHDQAPGQDIAAIPGSPPDLRRLQPGCSFAPRCSLAMEACRKVFPGPAYPAPGRMARCLRVAEVSPGLIGEPA
jgi:peptide/nickel transport system ATP-binding protein